MVELQLLTAIKQFYQNHVTQFLTPKGIIIALVVIGLLFVFEHEISSNKNISGGKDNE